MKKFKVLKMKLFNYYLLLLSSMLLLGINSCKSKKEIIRTPLHTTVKADNELFSDILSKQLVYSTFSSKLNLALNNGKRTLASKASLKIINDQMIQLSVQPLFGVEMFRFHIDNDTLIILDRMNKRYVKESINELKKRYSLEFDYHTLQSLFTNKLFLGENSKLTPSDYTQFTYGRTASVYYLKSTNNNSQLEYFFTINGDDRITFTHLLNPINKYSLQWSYSDFTWIGAQTFPSKMKIEASSPHRKIDIEITYSDIELDKPVDLSVTIPKDYSQVDLYNIINIITGDNS